MGKFFENHAYLLLHNCEFIFLSCDRFIAASGNIKKKKKNSEKKHRIQKVPHTLFLALCLILKV